MARWDPVVQDKESFVRPVGHEAQDETSQVQNGHRAREHHDDPDHCDEHGEAVLVLDIGANVKGLILALKQLLGLSLVAGAATVDATLQMAEHPERHARDWHETVDERRCEDRGANNIVPVGVEIQEVSVEEELFHADDLEHILDEAICQPHVDNKQDDSSVNELNDPHFRECRPQLTRDGVMALEIGARLDECFEDAVDQGQRQ